MEKLKKVIRSKYLLIPAALVLGLTIFIQIKTAYLGEVEYISFNSDIKLEGVLTKPNTPGPHPAVILLHGSGGSHQAFDKWYFKFHANALVEKGFAVLAYTKRGSGDHDIDYKYFTYKDLMGDALAAVNFLRQRPDIDQQAIGLMGISESGWFTPEVAAQDGNIAFIINRVSSPFHVAKTVEHEVRMDAFSEGFTRQEIEQEIIPLTTQIWQFYIDVFRDTSKANGPDRDAINQKLAELNQDDRFKKWFTSAKLRPYDPHLYASRGKNWAYDPLPYLKKIEVPILYIMGGKDRNMPTQEIVTFLKRFSKEENKNIRIKVYPEASHYLYKWGMGSGPYEGLYEDGYLDLLSTWAAEQVNQVQVP